MVELRIKYHDPHMPRLKKIPEGDWIDLYVANIDSYIPLHRQNEDGWTIYEGDILLVNFGISVELPPKYEALIVPRSSLFKKYGLILLNSMGVVDNSYKGDNDVWKGYFYCLKVPTGKVFLPKYERIAQFRIIRNMPQVKFIEVENLGNEDRGGFGSTDQNKGD